MQRTPKAGGFFLVAPILLGFVIGLATGDAMRGVLIGTAIGIVLAVGLWLVDRRAGTWNFVVMRGPVTLVLPPCLLGPT